ncbi:DUF4442 domain-containing protein [Flavobacterium sp.]|uniref:DUF4442 domain-containing protein n=1 Tax=Flavobacterium sp. TaxID=239 RepID=UPI003BE25514
MEFSPNKLNFYLFFKLPSAFLCGVRVKSINTRICETKIKQRWLNQNPFNSIYFAVQAMAAELTTGALVMYQIKKSKKNISMLVTNINGNFTKKARGQITFTCSDGELISEAIQKAIVSTVGQTLSLKSIGVDEEGAIVSEMDFEWSIRLKQ